jgi:class 3 adenylate cyclase/dihydrofolate reductase
MFERDRTRRGDYLGLRLARPAVNVRPYASPNGGQPVRLIVTSYVTVDGIVEAPGFDEHRDGRNGWALRVQNEEDEQYNKAQLAAADALLLGRKTWQIWAAFWPTATGDTRLAERINRIPKYVVSKTLTAANWTNSTLISGNVAAEVAKLKAQPGGELVVYGSPDLVDELLRHDLVDEHRLLVYPVILGSGKHLFRDRIDVHNLRLITSHTFSSGVVLLTYAPEDAMPTSRYEEAFSWTPEQVRSLRAAEDVDRVLATVMFTDVVDSTGRAVAMGDRAWRRLVDRHAEVVRREVDRWMGEHIEITGDGVMATFDAPTRALRCAFRLHETLGDLGLQIRAGIHTGEVERREAGVGGIGVHIAARVMGQAAAGQVVVTRTVRDLAVGTDLAFAPRGAVSLRGVPGQWELFDVSIG